MKELDNQTLIFRKFASLYFCCVVDDFESQFAIMDLIYIIVEMFNSVFVDCREVDIKMNPEKVKNHNQNQPDCISFLALAYTSL